MPNPQLRVIGARTHNLQGVSVDIPRDQLVVLTGVSGSGKSSLAFDTIYAEGQRRYVESLSSYARQFLDQMEKPEVEAIEGLSPAIAIQQKTTSSNPRSTVATVTEIYDHLRLLWARAGVPACPSCGEPVDRQSAEDIVHRLLDEPERTKVMILAPLARETKGTHEQALLRMRKEGFTRLRVDGQILTLDDSLQLDGRKKHDLDVVVDRVVIKEGVRSRLADSVELALRLGEGLISVVFPERGEERLASERYACAACGVSLPELEPKLFSFNSPKGACPGCAGLGETSAFDPDHVVPQPELSLADGAIAPWASNSSWYSPVLEALAAHYGVAMTTPWQDLPEAFRAVVLEGSGEQVIEVLFESDGQRYDYARPFEGVLGHLRRRYAETGSETARAGFEELMSSQPCSDCQGSRLRREADVVRLSGYRLYDITSRPVTEARVTLDGLELDGRQAQIADRALRAVRDRLGFLEAVGLGYLTLDRRAATLSGGEAQRIRLATQLGSALMGVLYVLDEPSIGLHPRDTARLLDTLTRLRDLGNTVLVVEHDASTIRAADFVVDMGPGAGREGGRLVAAATPADLERNPDSLTGRYLAGQLQVSGPRAPRPADPSAGLRLEGARGHNLQGVDLEVPLGVLACVSGVSGSGKSTLINQTLLPALQQRIQRSKVRSEPYDALHGAEQLDKVIAIDQSPIGRTPRSNPATYTGLFTDIRDLFASLPEAKMRGFKAGRFSFNKKGGRCERCEGDGILRVEMHFLPDVYVTCEACAGRRYNTETLEVRYKGSSVAEVLDMTVEEALGVLASVPAAERKLRTLREVGLGYVRLGQSATTLSGGEAQRVKLAKELARVATGRSLYVLDEPTTGLHFEDVRKLLDVLQRLVEQGNTVLVIEHDLDVIASADWVVDLGPEGGEGGGRVVAAGPPQAIARCAESHTGAFLARRGPEPTPRRAKARRARASR